VHGHVDQEIEMAEDGFTASSCQFKMEVEKKEKKVLLETAEGGEGADFITVGLGNIDKIPIIEDGDIQ